jgi:DNA-binding NarL/FixJ family response regulator
MPTDVEVVSTAVIRNCYRCGEEFRPGERELVCLACRKPRQPKPEPRHRHLTFREKQVVNLVSQAKLNKEIAYELHLSAGTIKEYMVKIFRKLGVKNRTDLAVWALTHPMSCSLTPMPRAAATPQADPLPNGRDAERMSEDRVGLPCG